MSQVTRTSRREQVLLFGINYARGGVACERQLLGSTSSLGGRGECGRVQDWGWRPSPRNWDKNHMAGLRGGTSGQS